MRMCEDWDSPVTGLDIYKDEIGEGRARYAEDVFVE